MSRTHSLSSVARAAVEKLVSAKTYQEWALNPDEPFACIECVPATSLSADEQAAITSLLHAVRSALPGWPAAAQREAQCHCDDLTLLRFVEARPAGTGAALQMFREAMVWRSTDQRSVSRICVDKHYYAPRGPACAAAWDHFYAGFSSFDRDGFPVFLERLGKVDLSGLAREGEPLLSCLLDAYVNYMETAFRAVRAASCATGEYVKATIVVDTSGFNLSLLRNLNLIKLFASIGPAYYPEVTHRVLIVNAPRFATMAWAILAPMLPKATRDKVSVHSSSATPAVLKRWFDPWELPTYLGGTKPDNECRVPFAMQIPPGLSATLRQGAATPA